MKELMDTFMKHETEPSPVMSALKDESSPSSVTRALSFYPGTGSSIISKELKEDIPKEVSKNFLMNPEPTILEAIIQTAKSINSNKDAVLEIAKGLLQTCYYFNVIDINQIAYILATVHHESEFGKRMLENDSYLLHKYEPVFSKQDSIDTNQLITKDADQCKSLIALERQLTASILNIYKSYVHNLREIKKIETTLDELMAKATAALQEILDDFLSKFLEYLENKNDQPKILEWFIDKKIPLDHFSQFKGDNLPKSLNEIIKHLKELKVNVTDSNLDHDPLLVNFFKLQLKLLLIDWLLTRIYKSIELGNTKKGDGERFKGKGLVQITGRSNYQRFTDLFSKNKICYKALQNLGVENIPDFVENSDLAKDPNIAIVVAVAGMAGGWFTGRKLRSYNGSPYNFFDARGIISTDKTKPYGDSKTETKGEHIKIIAEKYVKALQTEDSSSQVFPRVN